LTTPDPCELLEWDTTFWEIRIARARSDSLTPELVEQIDTWCHKTDVECLYFLARSDDVTTTRVTEQHAFRLVDIRMTLHHSVAQSTGDAVEPPAYRESVREARSEDLDTLGGIARTSHHDARWYYDPHFPRERCDSFYETWIRRSYDGWADVVLVADVDGRPSGYVSCHLQESGSGSIGLVGLGNWAQGKGIGKQLVNRAVDWFEGRGVQDIYVVTQGRNVAAQRLYQRCGFLTDTVQLWYHKWYGNRD
jgi:RimJ/RimL family protein N-acetyltransferase